MPDAATTRDVALKLEQWAATLDPAERQEVEAWMALGLVVEDGHLPRRWWFEPSFDPGRLLRGRNR